MLHLRRNSWFCLFVIFVAFASPGYGASIKSDAGLELGGNGTLLFSDASLGAFGIGAGYQGSVFWSLWNDKPMGLKIRFERLSLTEEATQKSRTDYLVPGTLLKSMTQVWTFVGAGVEGRFENHGQTFFWELLLGYAFGGGSTVTVTNQQQVSDTPQTTASGFALSGGAGIKKNISPKFIGYVSVRTLLFAGAPYSTDPMIQKAYILLPVMFNVGASYSFDFLN